MLRIPSSIERFRDRLLQRQRARLPTPPGTNTNLLGTQPVLLSRDDTLSINGDKVGGEDTTMVANGTRVFFVSKVLRATK